MDESEDQSLRNIGSIRKLARGLAHKVLAQGVTTEDVAIALGYSALDVAQRFNGDDPIKDLEWLRSLIDVAERQLLSGGDRAKN